MRKRLKANRLIIVVSDAKTRLIKAIHLKKRGLDRKNQIIRELGGQCSICGYKQNIAALTFHHKDPSQKRFKLDVRSLSNRTYSKIKDELNKCILVCHNCHAELHNPQHNLE